MGLFSKRTAFVSTPAKQALEQAVQACHFESLEDRQMLSLMIDLRLPGGGKTANITGTGQTINVEVWAVSQGGNTSGSDDGFQMLLGSFKTGSGGSVKGDLTATLFDPFTGLSSFEGNRTDLDGDGDIDVGSNDPSTSDNYFVARAGSMTYSGGNVSGSSNSFKIAEVQFKVTSVGSAGDVNLSFVPRGGTSGTAIWAEDRTLTNDLMNPNFSVGSPITLRVPGTGGGGGGTGIDATLSSGVLTVRGTNAVNNIKLNLSGANLIAEVDGKTKSFAASSVSKIKVYGLDGNDVITIGSGVKATRLDGGNGNDVLNGGSLNDTLLGGTGNDQLKGNAGNDLLDGGTGADKVFGGSGRDLASYFSRTKPLTISLDDVANDGEAGEVDNIRVDVEDVEGGAGNDVIRGNSLANQLRGNDGRDSLYGGKGNDSLTGGNGNDRLYGEDGDDKFFAKDNTADSLYGGLGNDRSQHDTVDIRKDIEAVLA